MSTKLVLAELQQKLNLSMYALSKKLGLKSTTHVWMLKNGLRSPSIPTCYKIINLGKELNMKITLDMLRGQE